MGAPAIEPGIVAAELLDELPGLELATIEVAARARRSPAPVRRRLRELASRITGARVVQARRDDVPWAYRVLWRRLGLDPDSERTPIEALLLERLRRGGLPSQGMPADAAVVATLETGVPIVLLDAAAIAPPLALRPAATGETLAGDPAALRAGEVVYADSERPVARLSGAVAADCEPGKDTARVVVAALAPAAVPAIAVHEALWTVADMLAGGGSLESSTPGRTQ